MARARNIKPGFFENEILGVQDPFVCLLFAGLWTLADKAGILEDRPMRIKAQLFPYRESLDVNGHLTVLQRLGFIRRYEVDGSRYIEVTNFKKHQSPHHTERASIFPAYSSDCEITVNSPLDHGGNPPDSLIPDSLIPDSLIPEEEQSQTPSVHPANTDKTEIVQPDIADNSSAAAPTLVEEDQPALIGELFPVEIRAVKPAVSVKASREQEACRATWDAYSDAYRERYGVAPVRNAKVNSAIKSFTRRIGADESPGVARYFVSHADAFYGRKCHDVGLMLADAEKLRTEWATQRQVTGVTARQQERTGTMRNAVDRILAERGAA